MRFLGGLSLKARLLIGSTVWILCSLLATGLVLTSLFRGHVEQRFDAELSTHLEQLLAGLQRNDNGGFTLKRPMTDPRFDKPYSMLYWQVDGPHGALLRSRSLWDQALPLPQDTPADGELHRHIIAGPLGQRLVAVERKVSIPGEASVIRAAVADDLDVIEHPTQEFARTAALSLATLAVGLMLAIAAQILSTLRPLRRLQDALRAVRSGQLSQVPGQFPAEVQPLVDDLNRLLHHNAEVLERARTEAGNLAHQLKTPLAVIMNETYATGAVRSGVVLDQVRLMARQIDYALTRARAAASGKTLGATTPVDSSLEKLATAMRTLYAQRGIEIRVDAYPATVQVEPQDFDELVGNLLDNACKWARSRVAVSASIESDCLILAIEDDGPGLPEEERSAVFERGRKLDDGKPGAGLGLSIVRDLADAYGGSVRLDTARLGGLRAQLSLPLAGQDRPT